MFDAYRIFINVYSPPPVLMCCYTDYTEGAELVDAVLDVVRKEAEGTDCLQGMITLFGFSCVPSIYFFRT